MAAGGGATKHRVFAANKEGCELGGVVNVFQVLLSSLAGVDPIFPNSVIYTLSGCRC